MTNLIQQRIQSFLEQHVAEGQERGIQIAAYLDGDLVVDAWAGLANAATGQPVTGETLLPVLSTTKGMVATLIHLLTERGQLDYDAPIADFWPEFAAHGKGGITLRHALSHTAGIPYMPAGLGYAELCDWDFMCTAIADLKPASPPGGEMVYHAMTFGWILGEVARRADGRAFPDLLQDEICAPLGLNTMFVGIPDEVEPAVAMTEGEEACVQSLPQDAKPESVPAWLLPLQDLMNRPDARRACIPGSNGIMNARAIARHYAALLPGGIDGIELLPPRRVRLATEAQLPYRQSTEGPSKIFGMGYRLGGPSSIMGERPTAFGHAGHGGSIGFADPERRLAVGLARNRLNQADTPQRIVDELRKAADL